MRFTSQGLNQLLIGVVFLLGIAHSANAAIITRKITFSGNEIVASPGPGTPPYSTVNGVFELTIDDSVSQIDGTTAGLVQTSFNIPLDGPTGFIWNHDVLGGFLILGGMNNLVNGVNGGNDFLFLITNFLSPNPTPGFFVYTSTIDPNNGFVNNTPLDLVITDVPSAIPEPEAWLLLLMGFGIVGAVTRTRLGKGTPSLIECR